MLAPAETQVAGADVAPGSQNHPHQHMSALERANKIRLARAALKRRIADGDLTAAQVILTVPEEVATWTIGKLLLAQRGWGDQRVRKFLGVNQISEVKTLGALTERQRMQLAAQLQGRPVETPDVMSTLQTAQAAVKKPIVPVIAPAAPSREAVEQEAARRSRAELEQRRRERGRSLGVYPSPDDNFNPHSGVHIRRTVAA
jgi:hypothetical protein